MKTYNNGKRRQTNILQRNKDSALKKAKEYYYANKDKINKQLRDKYSNLSEKKGKKKRI